MSHDALAEESKAVAPSKETIKSPCVDDELKFEDEWALWEQYEVKRGDWSNSLAEVASFQDVEGFWRIWNFLPHNDPANFFAHSEEDSSGRKKNYANVYQVAHQTEEMKIGSLCFFKAGIRPEWEDLENKKGGSFTYKPKSDLVKAKKFWETFVIALVTNNVPHNKEICGIRVVEKNQFHKFEIWMKYGFSSEFDHFKEQKEYLDKLLCDTLGEEGLKFDFFKHND